MIDAPSPWRIHLCPMRFLAGTLSILLLLPSLAFAQAKGEVEKIGFENYYRPDCWTPMTVRLVPDTSKSEQFQIQVKQEDLDRDHPIFSRLISLTGNAEGKSREQRFRVYFKPEPTNDGLPDANDPTHFVVPYERDGRSGTIDGWLQDNGKVKLRVRPTPEALD